MSLRFGYYGEHQLVLGPNSSRLIPVNSLFVEQVQVKDKAKQGLLLYGFKNRPELSLETNWTLSKHLFADSYDRRGFSLWLNEGSRIWMAWEVTYGGGSYGDIAVVLIKGEQNLELRRYYPSSQTRSGDTGDGNRSAEYTVGEDDNYYFGIMNLSPRTTVITMKVNVTSKIYDINQATDICSTNVEGSCKFDLHLPGTCYYVLTTPNGDEPAITFWQVDLSFVARLVSYLLVTGFVLAIVYLVLKYLGVCGSEQASQEQVETTTAVTETDPILPIKEMPRTYGTTEEEPGSSLCCSSEDLYDGKLCVICYDERRDCFFTPCGHSATCYACAKRIMEEDNKVCPICRRLIHRLRRLLSSKEEPQSALSGDGGKLFMS